ncbi:MAG: transcriptional regulator PpsR [Hyphomonadaceae bacterium]|nr:transcriptional regulator PpsR [Hyphomonadaceae bacterium]
MTVHSTPFERIGPRFARNLLGGLDGKVAASVIAAGGDVAMIIDRGGFIRDIAVNSRDMVNDGFEGWLDRRWADTVTSDSRHKVEEMLRDAANDVGPRWREINHAGGRGDSVAVRYIAVNAGEDGRVIAIGRDHRATAELQQRLIQAQQTMERDYTRLREAESRYRLLFQLASEAVIVIDAATRRIVEANPAAERLVGGVALPLVGRNFASVFDAESHDAAVSLLAMAHSGGHQTAQTKVKGGGRSFTAAASVFRQDRASLYLVRLSANDAAAQISEPAQRLLNVLERIPDAFVVTDENLRIVAQNTAFLDITRLASKEQAQGHSLDAFLGRPEIDRNILVSSLRQHGSLKNFATILRNRLGEQEDVEVSAVHVSDADRPYYGFSIRSAVRAPVSRPRVAGELPRSVEQLSQLVGRVTLKELVRETTDLVEKLCIEAALELTGDNRASAAEILGLSRQSLYSKLHRYGIGDLTPNNDP